MINPTTLVSYSCTHQRYGSEESLPLIIIETQLCNAVISLYGGQVLEFTATNKAPLLWLSPAVVFKRGTAIRGGIPICAPWFGAHPQHALNHGFARTSMWQQKSVQTNKSGELMIKLSLTENDTSRLFGYDQFEMTLTITLGSELNIDFAFSNHSNKPQSCEWALHSYFAVEDCNTAYVSGLDKLSFHDKARDNSEHISGPTEHFIEEVDRFWIIGSSQQTIHSANNILISGVHCDSIIIWNPGKTLASAMKDIKQHEKFICVERGAINTNAWNIDKKSTQIASMTIENV